MLKLLKKSLWYPDYPKALWLKEAEERTKYTPDVAELEKRRAHLIFVPDELQQNHKNQFLLSLNLFGTTPIANMCPAFTKPEFLFYKHNLEQESYPVAFQRPATSNIWGIPENKRPKTIRGELYVIRPYQFLVLDKYKENGVVFERKYVDILVPYLKVVRNAYATCEIGYRCAYMQAWMYLGVEDYWKERLDAGFQFNQVKTVSLVSKSTYGPHDFVTHPYYHFTTDEYKS